MLHCIDLLFVAQPPCTHLQQIVRHFDGADLFKAANIVDGVAEVTTMALHTDPGTGCRICVVSCCASSGVGSHMWPWIEYSPTHVRGYKGGRASTAHVGGPVLGALQPWSSVMTELGRGKGNGIGHRVGLRWLLADFQDGVPWASTKLHLDVDAGQLDALRLWFRKRVHGEAGTRLIAVRRRWLPHVRGR